MRVRASPPPRRSRRARPPSASADRRPARRHAVRGLARARAAAPCCPGRGCTAGRRRSGSRSGPRCTRRGRRCPPVDVLDAGAGRDVHDISDGEMRPQLVRIDGAAAVDALARAKVGGLPRRERERVSILLCTLLHPRRRVDAGVGVPLGHEAGPVRPFRRSGARRRRSSSRSTLDESSVSLVRVSPPHSFAARRPRSSLERTTSLPRSRDVAAMTTSERGRAIVVGGPA